MTGDFVERKATLFSQQNLLPSYSTLHEFPYLPEKLSIPGGMEINGVLTPITKYPASIGRK